MVRVPVDDFLLNFGTALDLAEKTDASADHISTLARVELGLEVRHPLGLSIQGRKLDMGLYLTVTHFINELELFEPDGDKTAFTICLKSG